MNAPAVGSGRLRGPRRTIFIKSQFVCGPITHLFWSFQPDHMFLVSTLSLLSLHGTVGSLLLNTSRTSHLCCPLKNAWHFILDLVNTSWKIQVMVHLPICSGAFCHITQSSNLLKCVNGQKLQNKWENVPLSWHFFSFFPPFFFLGIRMKLCTKRHYQLKQ